MSTVAKRSPISATVEHLLMLRFARFATRHKSGVGLLHDSQTQDIEDIVTADSLSPPSPRDPTSFRPIYGRPA